MEEGMRWSCEEKEDWKTIECVERAQAQHHHARDLRPRVQ